MAVLANRFSERLQAQRNTLLKVSDTFTKPLFYNGECLLRLPLNNREIC